MQDVGNITQLYTVDAERRGDKLKKIHSAACGRSRRSASQFGVVKFRDGTLSLRRRRHISKSLAGKLCARAERRELGCGDIAAHWRHAAIGARDDALTRNITQRLAD